MESKGMMGGLYRISEWIMRLMVINLLWILFSIPFIFISLPVLLNTSDPATTTNSTQLLIDLFWQMLPMAIIAPFTVIPATAAMYSVARKWVTGDEDVPLFKSFIRGYRQNYLQSMQGGFIFIIIGLIILVDAYFFSTKVNSYGFLLYFFIVVFVFLFAAFINFLSILVHFHMKLFQLLKNSILLTMGNPFRSIMNLLVTAAIVMISFKFKFLIPFFMGSMIAYATFWQFNRSLVKIQERVEKDKADALKKQEEEANKIEIR